MKEQWRQEERLITLYHGKCGERGFCLCPLHPGNMEEILCLQEQVSSVLKVPDMFALSDEKEFLESMETDYCYGLYDGKRLAALCICVLNRDTYRNLGKLCQRGTWKDYVTFETIQVHQDYRGYGIQTFFLQEVEKLAQKVDAKYLIATVAPANTFSHRNFDLAGYITLETRAMAEGTYNNAVRDLVCKVL